MGDLSFFPTAREIAAAGVGYLKPAEVTHLRRPGPDFWTTPRGRLLQALQRMDACGVEAAAACRRIYARQFADEFSVPTRSDIAACLRLLADVEQPEQPDAIRALADLLAPLDPEAA